MPSKIPCTLIEDLLPLHVDSLLSESSKTLVNEHLNHCPHCAELFRNASQVPDETIETYREADIDYLKKVKRTNRNKIWLSSLLLVILTALGIATKLYVIGYPVGYSVSQIDLDESTVVINAQVDAHDSVYSHYAIKNGELIVYGKRCNNKDKSFEINVENDYQETLTIGDNLLTPQKVIISSHARKIHELSHPYVGAMHNNAKLAYALGVSPKLGSFTNRLDTEAEPYGWTLIFSNDTFIKNRALFNAQMRSYACVFIALIDNLSIVEWEYDFDGVHHKETVTLEDAQEYLSQDIKSYSKSVETVNDLLNELGINQLN